MTQPVLKVWLICVVAMVMAASHIYQATGPGSHSSGAKIRPARTGFAPDSAWACHTDNEMTSRVIPPQSWVILGSLDTSASSHTVNVTWRPQVSRDNESRIASRLANGLERHDRTQPFSFKAMETAVQWIEPENEPLSYVLADRPSHSFFAHLATRGDGTNRHFDDSEQQDCSLAAATHALPIRMFLAPVRTRGVFASQVVAGHLKAASPAVSVYSTNANTDSPTFTHDNVLADLICGDDGQALISFVSDEYCPVSDIDGSGGLTVLLCDLDTSRNQNTDDAVPLLGCVRGTDFLNPDRDFSGDIIYIDRSVGTNELAAILSHELAHAATFSLLRTLTASHSESDSMSPPPVIPAWLNEAIAHSMERRLVPSNLNLRTRLESFRRASHQFPCVVPDGDHLSAYGRTGSRAAGMLFLDNVLSTRCANASLEEFVTVSASGRNGLEQAAGSTFAELFRDWTVNELHNSLTATVNGTNSSSGVAIHELTPEQLHQFDLRGTAAVYFQCSEQTAGQLEVTASHDAQLQITVVSANANEQPMP